MSVIPRSRKRNVVPVVIDVNAGVREAVANGAIDPAFVKTRPELSPVRDEIVQPAEAVVETFVAEKPKKKSKKK